MFRRKEKPLNNKTPHWFTDWHNKYFMPVHDRTKRNEKWIYIIITAIIASSIVTNGYKDEIAGLITTFWKALSS